MELIILIIAIAMSFVSIIVSVVIYQKGVQREKRKQRLMHSIFYRSRCLIILINIHMPKSGKSVMMEANNSR